MANGSSSEDCNERSSSILLDIPVSQQYLDALSLGEKIGIGISTAVCVLIVINFGEQVHFVWKKYRTGLDLDLKIKSLWLLGIYPVFAILSVLTLYVPRAFLLCDLTATVYLAVCLFHFTSLLIIYSGGISQLLVKVDNSSNGFNLRSPPCCLCFCLPVIKPTLRNFQRLRLAVLQTALLQPVISFLGLVMMLDDKYIPGKIAADQAYIYLDTVNTISTLVAMVGLVVLYRSCQPFLKKQSLGQKFAVLQLVLVLTKLQDLIFAIMIKQEAVPCSGILSTTVRVNAIHHMVIIGEMFLLALAARFFYRRPHNQHHHDVTDTAQPAGVTVESRTKEEKKGQEGTRGSVTVRSESVETTTVEDSQVNYRRLSDVTDSSSVVMSTGL